MMGTEKYGEGKDQLMIRSTTSCVRHDGESVGMGTYGCQLNELTAVLVCMSHLISTQ